jgi:ADP-L-glycero-D-manno-heptose 6-epimerase
MGGQADRRTSGQLVRLSAFSLTLPKIPDMIVVTGAAGFIGSCMVSKLNNKGIRDIVLVDDFSDPMKKKNFSHKAYEHEVDRKDFPFWFEEHHKEISFVFHIGARTDTAEFNISVLEELNLNYSKQIWNGCTRYKIPLVYASSAATYGDGKLGYADDHSLVNQLKPLNPYGISKNEFDKWVLEKEETPPYWYGLKFFNVFGPNEYHKGRMASVIFHAYNQICKPTGSPDHLSTSPPVRLFRSHNPAYPDGCQLRDFIYVKDVINVMYFLMTNPKNPGIYNLGTGKARTFLDLAKAVYNSMDLAPNIEFIDTPLDIRDKYQYFTEARMDKLRGIGYDNPFFTLEEGIEEYVQGYLLPNLYF